MSDMTDHESDAYDDLFSQETAALKAERDNWKETAAQFARNQDYYTSLLDRIAETFGKDAYISDDGSVQDSPLRAKMPELVCTLKAERDRLREALEKLAILGNEPLPGNSIRNVIAQKALAGIDKLRAELVDKCAEIKKSEIANPHYCIARLEEQVDNLMSVLDDNKTLIDAQIKEIAALKADIVLNSQLLARQCDLAREAETERDALRKRCEELEEGECQYCGKKLEIGAKYKMLELKEADSDPFKKIDDRLKELAKKGCKSIGCSGVDPDMCQNRPQNCQIIRKLMGCKEGSHE